MYMFRNYEKKILIDEETHVLGKSSMFLPFSGDLNGRRELQPGMPDLEISSPNIFDFHLDFHVISWVEF